MALSTQSTALQLVAGTLGSQARLQAGMEHLFIDGRAPSFQVALFRGPRPSQLEIDNHAFILEGEGIDNCSFIGIWQFSATQFTQIATRHTQFLGDGDYTKGKELYSLPTDPAYMVDTGEQDFFHAVFPRHEAYGRRATGNLTPYSTDGLAVGNGAAPTWGLVSFHATVASSERSITQTNNNLNFIDVHTPAARRRPFTVLAPHEEYNHYITVGDWRNEPEANLTLYRGAEPGQTTSPGAISPQRLRMRMNPVSTVSMGI